MFGEVLMQNETNFNAAFEVTTLYNFGDDIKTNYTGYIELGVYSFATYGAGGPPLTQPLEIHRCTLEEY